MLLKKDLLCITSDYEDELKGDKKWALTK